jgi:hypothetical protein
MRKYQMLKRAFGGSAPLLGGWSLETRRDRSFCVRFSSGPFFPFSAIVNPHSYRATFMMRAFSRGLSKSQYPDLVRVN